MLLIYSLRSSPRLDYVLQVFFNELIPIDFSFTTHAQEFQDFKGAKINYSSSGQGDGVFLFAHDLLFQKGIHEQKISVSEWKNIKTIFAHQVRSDLPFDPFAAAFYLLSRYEEYLPFAPDNHGRFPDQASLNFREGFHEIPVVNYYAKFLKEILQEKFTFLVFKNSSYKFQLTYDIDFAFAYKGKGILRNAAGFTKSLLKFNFKEIQNRAGVLSGKRADPYDTYEYQFSIHKRFNLRPVYFFLLGDYGRFDKNVFWKKKSFQYLIQKIVAQNDNGIHSSYASNLYPEKILIEKERLEMIAGEKIFRNRQHFLRLRFPFTYKNLLAYQINEDYSMGYASLTGFRAGIAAPFRWYQLADEKITDLRIFPFAIMDASLYYYMKLSPLQAFQKAVQLIDEVKKVNGTFQFLAHNDFLSEQFLWRGWREKFREIIEYGSDH